MFYEVLLWAGTLDRSAVKLTLSTKPRDPQVEEASEFLSLVEGGASLKEASEATGLSERSLLIRQRLAELKLYAHINRVVLRELRDSRLTEILLHGDARDAIAAAKALFPEEEAPLVQVTLTPEVAKMDVSLPGMEDEERERNQ